MSAPDVEFQSPDIPLTDEYDLGHVQLDARTDTRNEGVSKWFRMPFDGYVARVIGVWPNGVNNGIGMNLEGRGQTVPEDEEDNISEALEVDRDVFLPANYPNPTHVAFDDQDITYYPIRPMPEGEVIAANLRNNDSQPLTLQVNVTVTNFDPRELGFGGM